MRSGEWHDGIERVFNAGAGPQALLAPYLDAVAALQSRRQTAHLSGFAAPRARG